MKLLTPASPDWGRLFEPVPPVTSPAFEVTPHLVGMRHLLQSKRLVGLAAPQVGVFLRFFIYGGRWMRSTIVHTIINPEITWRSEDLREAMEGCASFPRMQKPVKRSESIRVKYENTFGDMVERLLGGYEARVFQHEFDHLNGVTLFPRTSETQQLSTANL